MASLHHFATAEQSREEFAHRSASGIRNRALEIFGDRERRGTGSRPRDIFDGHTPEELLESGDPAPQRRVLEVLIRIGYGVFS